MTQSEPQELCPSGEGLGVGAGGGVCGMGQRWETKRMTKMDREQEAVSEMETEMKWCNVSGSIENRRAAHRCSPRVKRGRVGWLRGMGGGMEEKKERKKGSLFKGQTAQFICVKETIWPQILLLVH